MEVDYVIEAVRDVARDGWRLLGDYTFDPVTGLWRHRRGVVEPPLRLADISYASGAMAYTATTATAGEEDLARYLEEGRRVMGEAAPPDLAGGVGDLLDADFELLRRAVASVRFPAETGV